jgi:hypothetical protein
VLLEPDAIKTAKLKKHREEQAQEVKVSRAWGCVSLSKVWALRAQVADRGTTGIAVCSLCCKRCFILEVSLLYM